ncbi:ATP-binding protein [Thiocystis violacea]|uniref:ATP-binding protein n=1 Tax=Thiocystis violacea TaxID=13725 RepID=UPI0034E2A549
MVLNLLSNAIKYNREQGELEVLSDMRGERLRLSIRDAGRGIEPARLPEFFEPFSRLGADRLGVEGTGIGFSLSEQLVRLMGGEIGMERAPGVGSLFWVELDFAGAGAGRLPGGLDLNHRAPGDALHLPQGRRQRGAEGPGRGRRPAHPPDGRSSAAPAGYRHALHGTQWEPGARAAGAFWQDDRSHLGGGDDGQATRRTPSTCYS